ncbi:MAG: RNA polymerase sigma factor [Muribaculaceae bacterium]|nr:RNA polymerase sigma factor [Muribaculaceae bacterium]
MLDASTFKQVLIPHHRRLYLLALRILGDRDEAQDAVQDLYMRLWEKRDTIEINDSLSGFLSMSMRNHCVSQLRSRKQSVDLDQALQTSGEDLSAAIESRDRMSYLVKFIETLPPTQREALMMRDLQGCEMSEIEDVLKISSSNARTILSRARTALRKHFENCKL